MRIRLLDIRGFGKFVNRKIEPGEGFNLVFGGNESGKSTLVEFITAMLFGIKSGKKSRGAVNSERSMRPWKGDIYAGAMEYDLDDGSRFRIERDFDKGTVHIRDGSARDITARFALDRDAGPRFSEAHLNLTRPVFEKSALIRQMQSAIDDNGREALLERLANLNASGGEDLSLKRALDALNAALLEKVGTGRSTTRPLDRVLSRLSELEEQKARILEQNERYLDAFLLLKEEKDRLLKLNRELDELTASRNAEIDERLLAIKAECLDLDRKALRLRQEIQKLETRLSGASRYEEITELSIETLSACLYEYREAHRRLDDLSAELKGLEEENCRLKGKSERLKPLREKVDRIEKTMAGIKNTSAEAAAGKENRRKPAGAGPAAFGLIAIAAALLAYSILRDAGPIFAVLSVAALLAGLLMPTGLFSKERRRSAGNPGMLMQIIDSEGFSGPDEYLAAKADLKNIASALEENQNRLMEVKKTIGEMKAKKEELTQKIALFVGNPEISGWERDAVENAVESFKAGYREYREDNGGLGLLEHELKACEDKKDLLFREASAIAKRDIHSIEGLDSAYTADAAPVRNPDLSSALGRRSEIEERIREKSEEVKASEIKIKALETRLENVPSLETLAEIEEEAALLSERKSRLEDAGRSLKIAADMLREAASGLQRNYTPALNKEVSRLVELITGGRYGGVRTDSGLNLHLEVPESEELMPLHRLSGGTIDQVYFAMRLAALGLLERGRETIPLFLDEPFAQYDEERVKNALLLLKDASKNRQVFFFTCRQRELELARRIWGDSPNLITLTLQT